MVFKKQTNGLPANATTYNSNSFYTLERCAINSINNIKQDMTTGYSRVADSNTEIAYANFGGNSTLTVDSANTTMLYDSTNKLWYAYVSYDEFDDSSIDTDKWDVTNHALVTVAENATSIYSLYTTQNIGAPTTATASWTTSGTADPLDLYGVDSEVTLEHYINTNPGSVTITGNVSITDGSSSVVISSIGNDNVNRNPVTRKIKILIDSSNEQCRVYDVSGELASSPFDLSGLSNHYYLSGASSVDDPAGGDAGGACIVGWNYIRYVNADITDSVLQTMAKTIDSSDAVFCYVTLSDVTSQTSEFQISTDGGSNYTTIQPSTAEDTTSGTSLIVKYFLGAPETITLEFTGTTTCENVENVCSFDSFAILH